ncbi:MAG: CcdB family protein [Roseateles sp.]|uniref:CcdB family protein n=1 Tax=Roseateles sp. TaxID=1971397 RepID=UPI004035AD53
MPRFDVYANPANRERKETPFFLDVQNEYINGLGTRIVIPLRREAAFGPRAQRFNPLVTVNDEVLVLDTAALGAVPLSLLKQPVVNLRVHRDDITTALETLFGAF